VWKDWSLFYDTENKTITWNKETARVASWSEYGQVQTPGTWTHGRAKETEIWPLNKETVKSGPASTRPSLEWRQSRLLLPLWTEPGLYLLTSVFRFKGRLERRKSRIASGQEVKDAKGNSKKIYQQSSWASNVHMGERFQSPLLKLTCGTQTHLLNTGVTTNPTK
jgi:hypothetical protein